MKKQIIWKHLTNYYINNWTCTIKLRKRKTTWMYEALIGNYIIFKEYDDTTLLEKIKGWCDEHNRELVLDNRVKGDDECIEEYDEEYC